MSDVGPNDEMLRAIREGSFTNEPDEKLNEWLRWLCTAPVPNEMIHHTLVNRASLINTILLKRYLSALTRQAERNNVIVIVLTIVATLAGFVQALFAILEYVK